MGARKLMALAVLPKSCSTSEFENTFQISFSKIVLVISIISQQFAQQGTMKELLQNQQTKKNKKRESILVLMSFSFSPGIQVLLHFLTNSYAFSVVNRFGRYQHRLMARFHFLNGKPQ